MKSKSQSLKKNYFIDLQYNIVQNDIVTYHDKNKILNLVKFNKNNASQKTKINRSTMSRMA